MGALAELCQQVFQRNRAQPIQLDRANLWEYRFKRTPVKRNCSGRIFRLSLQPAAGVSFKRENAVFIQIKYPPKLYATDDANYVPIELAAHIFSLTTSDMTDIADEDGELYKDEEEHLLVSLQWLIDTYEDRLCQLVNYEKLSFKTDGQGEIAIIIERKLE